MKIDFLANGTDSVIALTGQVDGWGKPPPNYSVGKQWSASYIPTKVITVFNLH